MAQPGLSVGTADMFLPVTRTVRGWGQNGEASAVHLKPGRIDHAGCSLRYWTTGNESGPLVVLSHGLGTDHHSYDALMAGLARDYFLLVWDIRGHGLSTTSTDFTLLQAVDDLDKLIQAIGRRRATLVGTSLGGTISQLYAYLNPDRVDGLVLLSCAPIHLLPTRSEQLRMWLTDRLVGTLPYWLVCAQAASFVTVRREVHSAMTDTLSRIRRSHFYQAHRAIVDSFFDDPTYRIPFPHLVALGSYDPLRNRLGVASGWLRSRPPVVPVEIPGASHEAMQDNPGFCLKMIGDFLRRTVYA